MRIRRKRGAAPSVYSVYQPVDFTGPHEERSHATSGEPLITQGPPQHTTAGPYVVDTITAPEKNAADAWMRFSGFDFFPDGHTAAICTWERGCLDRQRH